jgi:hypothetical protein
MTNVLLVVLRRAEPLALTHYARTEQAQLCSKRGAVATSAIGEEQAANGTSFSSSLSFSAREHFGGCLNG